MEVTVEHLGALQFEIKSRQHTIVSDQPPELLLASLGSCVGFYAAQYLRKHKLATAGTRIRVTADKLKDPARIDNFHIEIETASPLSEQDRAGVLDAAHHCLIHNTLLHAPSIAIDVMQPVPIEV